VKLTWLGWIRIISGLWRKKDPNASRDQNSRIQKATRCRTVSLSERRSRAVKKTTEFRAVQFFSDVMVGRDCAWTM